MILFDNSVVSVTRAKEDLLVAKQQHSDHVRKISQDHVSHQLQIQSLTESCEQLRAQLVTRQQEIEKYELNNNSVTI